MYNFREIQVSMDKESQKTDTSSDEWIRCQSKNRPGNFYMFNKATGEAIWCPVDGKYKSDVRIAESTKGTALVETTRPLQISKTISTPAQDRLKRLQWNLKKESKGPKFKIESKVKNNKPKVQVDIKNQDENINIKDSFKEAGNSSLKKPEGKSEINKEPSVPECKEERMAANIKIKQNYKETEPNERSSSTKAVVKPSELYRERAVERKSSKSSYKKSSTKRAFSPTLNECSSFKVAKITTEESANERSPGRVNSFMEKGDSDATTSLNPKSEGMALGIMDRIKFFCKKTLGITSKPDLKSPTNKQTKTNDNKKSGKRTASLQAASASYKRIKESIDSKKESEFEKNDKCLSLPSTLSRQECNVSDLPKSVALIPSSSSSNVSTNLFVPTYQPGSANSRLERLRQSLRKLSNDIVVVENIRTPLSSGATTCSVIRTHGNKSGVNATLDNELEPMDWQSTESEVPPSLNKSEKEETGLKVSSKNDTSSTSNLSCKSSTSTISEYYETVNENLLRFSADQASSLRNLKQNWLKDHYYFVVDTNVVLQNLTFIEDLTQMKLCDTVGTIIYVPYVVLQELDKLKMRSSSNSVQLLANRAIRFLNTKLEERNRHIQAQSVFDERKHLIDITSPDDSILNCCLQVKQNIDNVVLLSEDVNLRNKAVCSNLLVSTKSDLISSHPPSSTTEAGISVAK